MNKKELASIALLVLASIPLAVYSTSEISLVFTDPDYEPAPGQHLAPTSQHDCKGNQIQIVIHVVQEEGLQFQGNCCACSFGAWPLPY